MVTKSIFPATQLYQKQFAVQLTAVITGGRRFRILNLQVRNKQTEEAQINKWLLTKTCIIKLLQDKVGKNKQYINNIIYYSKLSYIDDENLAKGKML